MKSFGLLIIVLSLLLSLFCLCRAAPLSKSVASTSFAQSPPYRMQKSNTGVRLRSDDDAAAVDSMALLAAAPRADFSHGGSSSSSSMESAKSIFVKGLAVLRDEEHVKQTLQRGKLAWFVFLWYFFTVVYNVSNKVILNELDLPMTVAASQLVVGCAVFLPLWVAKDAGIPMEPRLWQARFGKTALMHGLGSTALVVSVNSGAVAFTHVVKALEPLFAAGLSARVLGQQSSPQVQASLLIIVLGVGIAAATDTSFGWTTFVAALVSNLCNQLRIVLAKQDLLRDDREASTNVRTSAIAGNKKSGGRALEEGHGASGKGQSQQGQLLQQEQQQRVLSSASMFRIITVLAAGYMLPLALIAESWKLRRVWQAATAERGVPAQYLLGNLLLSGVAHYLYNEVAFWVLDLVTPVTHAVGNALKRVVIIFMSILLLNSPVNAQGILGGTVALGGTLLYAVLSKAGSEGSRLGTADQKK